MSRYDAIDDPYCYRNSDCLKNKLGLRDTTLLEAFELEMSSIRADEALPTGRFDTRHYRRVHRHLFQDVYVWAGRYRSVGTSKAGNVFCLPEFIECQMERLFRRLIEIDFLPGATAAAFVAVASDFLADLNAIHPFREGNGRAQLAFLHLIAIRAGHPLRLDRVTRAAFLPAMIASFAGNSRPLVGQIESLLG